MDFLQIGLIFLIALLTIFLTVTGVQVFLILRDLKKALDNFNKIIKGGVEIVEDVERPVAAASNMITAIENGIRTLAPKQKSTKPKFYKRVMK
jgi:hypothetical protein